MVDQIAPEPAAENLADTGVATGVRDRSILVSASLRSHPPAIMATFRPKPSTTKSKTGLAPRAANTSLGVTVASCTTTYAGMARLVVAFAFRLIFKYLRCFIKFFKLSLIAAPIRMMLYG